MMTAILILVSALALGLAARLIRTWFQYRGDRIVTCPETKAAAGVVLDAKLAVRSCLGRQPGLRLEKCSRWPERQNCGQECLTQIEASPEDCLVRTILTRWYQDKSCAICHKPIGEIHWADHRPALLSPDRKTVAWAEVRPEDVPTVLETHAPVCWNCHIVQTFCREHPEMVVDWSRSARM